VLPQALMQADEPRSGAHFAQGTISRLATFPLMQKIEDYRGHAEECRTMARRARSPQEREMLLNMARTWDDLAVHRVEQIERQKRMAAGLGVDLEPC
jgi:hypothetical protein